MIQKGLETEVVFIVGVSRSGTSLLRGILNKSPQIAICDENHYLGHMLKSEGMRYKLRKYGNLNDDTNVARFVADLYSGELKKRMLNKKLSSHWRWIMRKFPQEQFLQILLDSPRDERSIFTTVLKLFAGRLDRPIYGEKTPAHFWHVPTIMEWYPKGKVIHILRDPRGVYISELRRRYKKPQTFPYKQIRGIYPIFKLYIFFQTMVLYYWSIRLVESYKKNYPNRYYLLKFEDLVTNHEENILKVCQFLNIEYHPKMGEQKVVSEGFRVGQSGFDKNAATRWKNHIDPLSKFAFSFLFSRFLKQYNYLN